MSFAQVLYEHFQSVQFDYELLQEFVQLSVAEFHKYLVTDIDDQHCVNDYYGDDHKFKGYPKVDLTVVTDGTWSMYNLTKLMAYLAEECDVSLFGSRLSVMHGRTGKWLVQHAISSAQVVYNITKEAGNLKGKSLI
ncbi:hypothetical protein J437_LFUL008979 [Ladona fulva]|uniref:Uncharacterized protein n=1 Tax=Ladona fulva TaxID=123851 RepID=A0A8K0K6A1_LADFU|nr:hypothetical protein J437_LFUL008979 [Ladona fulva]